MPPWEEHNWIPHTQILLNSYAHFVGEELIERSGDADDEARRQLGSARQGQAKLG